MIKVHPIQPPSSISPERTPLPASDLRRPRSQAVQRQFPAETALRDGSDATPEDQVSKNKQKADSEASA